MKVEDVIGIDRWKQIRCAVPDRIDDHERMYFQPVRVRLENEVLQRIEPGRQRCAVGERLERVQVPRVATTTDLRENRVGIRREGAADDCCHIGVVVQGSVERVDPEAAHLAPWLSLDERRGPSHHPHDTAHVEQHASQTEHPHDDSLVCRDGR